MPLITNSTPESLGPPVASGWGDHHPAPAGQPGSEWLQARVGKQGLGRYFEIVRDRWPLLLACVLLTIAAAVAYLQVADNVYQAEADLLVTPVSSQNSTYVGLGVITNTNDPTRDVLTVSKLVTTPSVARLVIDQLHRSERPLRLLKVVQATPVTQSNIVAVTVKAATREEAQSLANAFAEQTVVDRTTKLHQQIDLLLPALQRQVAATPVDQRGPGSPNDSYLALQLLRASNDPTLQVLAPAELPETPVSPRPKLTIAAGVLAGLILGLSAAFGSQALDERLRREEQLRAMIRVPLLGRIPLEKGRRRSRPIPPDQLSFAGREAFRSLRSSVVSSPAADGAGSRVVFLAGSTPSEGKTTTAINLAASLAQTGARVILIEADLRRPTVGAALGVAALHGTAEVLRGAIPLEDALVAGGADTPTLRMLLAAGPSMQLANGLSMSMAQRLVSDCRNLADYVIVDAPPLTQVSEGLPLAQVADDVIVVARLDRSSLARLADLGDILVRHGLRPTGMVLVGGDAPASYYDTATPAPGQRPGRGARAGRS